MTKLFALLFLGSLAPSMSSAQPVLQDRGRQSYEITPFGIDFQIRTGVQRTYTGADLAQIRECNGEWDHEYARVANAALPFESLVAHFGEEPFCEGVSWRDMQIRVYVLDAPVAQVARTIRSGSAAEIARLPGGGGPQPAPRETGRWAPRTDVAGWTFVPVGYSLNYGDYGGVASMDYFLRRFADHTFVIVFMYASSPVYEGDGVRVDPIASTVESVHAR